jgi:hypothetical protein
VTAQVRSVCAKCCVVLGNCISVGVTEVCLRNVTVKTNQGHQRVHYHFNSPAGPMTADMVYLKGSEEYIVYNWYTAEVTKLAPTVTLAPGYEGTALTVSH